ncbi:TonB-dependent receptor [Novosphingobium sp. PASSN1]|uniref:TonB-dependent receptor n=1 Tax=Novosphingobium sp. PASSN1 TaxID=2015561 RepID=UPI0025EF4FC9|nr:TonB-dependent receptor [Novosphingobium sp. PASSN1]
MKRLRKATFGSVSTIAVLFGMAGPAYAEAPAAEAATSQDIVVTARHRDERAQDIPVALSVVGADLLTKTNTTSVADLSKLAPSLSFQAYNPRNTNLNIRGLGNNIAIASDGLDPGVGFYIDQVYYNRPGTSAFDLIDIERIEVLRGPQGTLYGKNTTAGAISVTTAKPKFTPEANAELSAGNLGFLQGKAAINIPLVDNLLAVRLSGSVTTREGNLTNQFTGTKQNNRNSYLVRGQILLTPSSTVSVRLIGDYSKQNQDCCAQVLAGIVAPANGKNFRTIAGLFGYTPVIDPFARMTVNDRPISISNESGGASAQIDVDLIGATLTSVSAWRFWNWSPVNDLDFTPLSTFAAADNVDRQNQYSQELRISSSGSHKLDYAAGLFFYDETIDQQLTVSYGPAATPLLVSQALPGLVLNGVTKVDNNRYRTTSLAAYGQATFHLTDALSLTGGLRYSHDDKRGHYSSVASGGLPLAGPLAAFAPLRAAFASSGTFDVQSKTGKVSGSANLSYRFGKDVLIYAGYSRGNRSGGLNLTQLASGISPVVAPESIDAYEIGFKSTLFDNHLIFNVAGFLENDRNYQATVADPTRLSVSYLANVPKVRSKGVEIDTRGTLSDNISFYGALAYTDAKFVDYPAGPCPLELTNQNTCNLAGYRVAGIPKWSASFGGELKQPVTVFRAPSEAYLGFDYSYRSSVNNGGLSAATLLSPLHLVNARLGARALNRRMDVSVWVKNLFDKRYLSDIAVGVGNTGLLTGQLGDQRTFGATLRFHF